MMEGERSFFVGGRQIGGTAPCYIIAEVSCNHEGDLGEAKAIIKAAADGGADAVKIQTYTPETITRNFDNKPEGTIWADVDLYDLYGKAYTPWEWSFELKKYAKELGLHFFSSPFDETAVDFLVDKLGVGVLKIASFEVVDTKLLEKSAKTGLPIIISNGMTDFLELKEAIEALRKYGCKDLAVLHCNSGYPAAFDEANLKTMQVIERIFDVCVGVSDHTLFADPDNYFYPMAHVTPLEAVKLGAKIVEVHLTLDRDKARDLFESNEGGFDWPFSMNPDEFEKMVSVIREYERSGKVEYGTNDEASVAAKTHGQVCFEPTEKELSSRKIRPSLWVTSDILKGDILKFAAEDKSGNFDSIRPSGGLHIRFADFIEGHSAAKDMKAGTPLSWDCIYLKQT